MSTAGFTNGPSAGAGPGSKGAVDGRAGVAGVFAAGVGIAAVGAIGGGTVLACGTGTVMPSATPLMRLPTTRTLHWP